MNGRPAVEQDTRKESYRDKSVDGSEESIRYKTADDATWYSEGIHDQEKCQCLR
jgi:hypothetical protein